MVQHIPLNSIIDRSLNYGRQLIEKFVSTYDNKNIKVVLDIGAGWGNDLLITKKINPSVELHAIEVYPEYQKVLEQKNIIVHPLNIECDIFPFDNESVDIIIANQILEHTKEIFWILHESSRILKIGGSIIVGVPNLASLHNRMLLAIGKQPTCIQNHSAHVRGFTKNDILKIFSNVLPGGYRLKGFGGSNFYPFPPFIAKPLAKLFPTMAWGIFLMIQKIGKYNNEFVQYPVAQQLETNFYVGKNR